MAYGTAVRLWLAAALLIPGSAAAADLDYAAILKRIARDIETLRPGYPQLERFSAADDLDIDGLRVSYAYHTHRSARVGGWTAGVPNPNDDGLWFHIDFHDSNSTAQIHTQPMSVPQCIGDKRVSFLILEGRDTKPVGGAIGKILEERGVTECHR